MLALTAPLGLSISEVTSRRLLRARSHSLELKVESVMPRMLGRHGWGEGLIDMSLVYG
jgi:hypothetical protein